jgi:hypothetical protein
MNNSIKTIAAVSLGIITLFSSCRKKEDPIVTPPVVTEGGTGKVKLEFANKVGSNNLILNTTTYTNQAGNTFNVTKFSYFITNIKLNKQDGGQFAETESYHLLKQTDPASLTFDLSGVPNGTYKSITFMIGVDSTRNVSGAQTGALEQNNDMFWSWNTGYIMMKFEGTSPQSTQAGNVLQLHAGGFSGANSVLRTVTLTFPNDLVVNSNTPHMHINADLLKVFASPNVIDFSTMSAVHMPGAGAKMLADNYMQMFTVTVVGE